MSNELVKAFLTVCEEAEPLTNWYLTLVRERLAYGGPEEGGWWKTISEAMAFQKFATEDEALAAQQAVEKFAKELTRNSQVEYGEYCSTTCEWLEERGLDADYLPESDGPESFYTTITQDSPYQGYQGPDHYE